MKAAPKAESTHRPIAGDPITSLIFGKMAAEAAAVNEAAAERKEQEEEDSAKAKVT